MTSTPPLAADEAATGNPPQRAARARGLRAFLWVALVVGAGADVLASAVLANPWAGSASGLLVLACLAGLVVLTRRDRAARKAGA